MIPNSQPEYALSLLLTILRHAGYEATAYDETLSPLPLDLVMEADLLALTVMCCNANRAIELVRQYRTKHPNRPIIMGGSYPTYLTQEALQHADIVVRGEGDESLPEVLQTLSGKKSLESVAGISFRNKGQIIHTPPRPRVMKIDRVQNLDYIWKYRERSLVSQILTGRFHFQVMETSRGCPFQCKYCSGIRILGNEYRKRSIPSILEELKKRVRHFRSRRILFVDNNFAEDPEGTKAILKAIIKEKLCLNITCLARVEMGFDAELVELYRKAGGRRVYVGLETLNPKQLIAYRKGQNLERMQKGIEGLRQGGVQVIGSFMAGGDNDSIGTVKACVDFALEQQLENIAIYAFFEIPGFNSGLVPAHRLLIRNLDYLNGNFVCIWPKQTRPSILQREIIKGYQRFYSFKNIFWKKDFRSVAMKIILKKGYDRMLPDMEEHAQYLEKIEERYYRESNLLDETLLIEDTKPLQSAVGL